MKFIFMDKTKKYLDKKSIDSLVIDVVDIKTCWIKPCFPSVLPGKPDKNHEKFTVHQVDGITIYANKSIPFNSSTIPIKIRRFFHMHEIYVDAVDLTH